MDNELQKIEAYIEEVGRTWEKNPELVLCRQFFELWEEAQKPAPFAVKASFELLDQTIEPPDKHTTAVFCWDFSEETPCLKLEYPGHETRYNVFVSEGIAELGEPTSQELDDSGVTFGERLEFILDIISDVRKRFPSRNVMELQKSEYNDSVHHISEKYDDRTVRLMSKLKLPEIKKLIDKAVQDMALDELSDQLVLPLDGSYAAGSEDHILVDRDRAFAVSPSLQRTRYTIARDLRFLCRAGQVLSEIEQDLVVSFENCEVLEGENPAIVRVSVKEEVPLRKGESLMVFVRGERAPVAKFKIEINDRCFLIGQIRWPDQPETLTSDYFARPHRSPAKYMAQLMEAFAGEFERESRFESAALNAGLGVDDFTFEDSSLTADGDIGLDTSQKRAWANAVNPHNPIVLIQGPPGTGKTHVLEKVLRDLAERGKRVVVAAPSHTAVDNVCRRVLDLPVLRIGRDRDKIAPEVAAECWIGELSSVHKFQTKRTGDAAIYAGTHVGLLRNDIVMADLERNGLFDAIIFDEAGMARMDEFLICAKLAHRAILFGDHQQLPPFPLPEPVLKRLRSDQAVLRSQESTVTHSPLQWLLEERNVPVFVLQSSYRCQNPRLMRFSSTLFYNAQVKASAFADYYKLPFDERQARYPLSTLRFYTTSRLPLNDRCERLIFDGGQPGFENPIEARFAASLVCEYLQNYPLTEITVIAPYRRQVHLIREALDLEQIRVVRNDITDEQWESFVHSRISTVDSFQGGESDVVIICYVRSSAAGGIGFVDDPNRINVAHTRCRREMAIVGDLTCLCKQGRDRIFDRMYRAIDRDGEIIEITPDMVPPEKPKPVIEESEDDSIS